MAEAQLHTNNSQAVAVDVLRQPNSDELGRRTKQQRHYLPAIKDVPWLQFQPEHGYKETSISDLVANTENQLWWNPKLRSGEETGGAKREENHIEEQRNAATRAGMEEQDEAWRYDSASRCEEETAVDRGHDCRNDEFQGVTKLSRALLLSRVFDSASMPRPTTWQTWSDLETDHRCAFLERRGRLSLRNRKLLDLQSTLDSTAHQLTMSGNIEGKPPFLQTSVFDSASIQRHRNHHLPGRICRFCNRQFPSGRALGGHMRVHGTDVHSTSTNMKLKCSPSNSSNCEDRTLEYLELHRTSNKVILPANFLCQEPSKLQSRLENSPLYSSLKKKPDSRTLECDEDGGNNDTNKRLDMTYSSIEVLQSKTVRPRMAHDVIQADSNIGRPRACSECGKVFCSWKALFGHMRCHPEREWRGMNFENAASVHKSSLLPKKLNSARELLDAEDCLQESGNSGKTNGLESDADSLKEESEAGGEQAGGYSSMDDPEVEFDCTLGEIRRSSPRKDREHRNTVHDLSPAWPTKRRSKRMRGTRTRIDQEAHMFGSLEGEGDPSSPAGTDPESDLHDLANCLVLLSASTAHRDSCGQQPTEAYESSYSNVGDVDDDMRSGDVVAAGNKQTPLSSTDRIPTPRINGFKYECRTCKRWFKSHQALGGHRASHRKIKGCFTRSLEPEEGHESTWDSNIEEPEMMRFRDNKHGTFISKQNPDCKKATKVHRCSICQRIFPTGQALGGHKRCHWTGHEKLVDAASTTNLSCTQLSDLLHGGSPRIVSSTNRNRKMQDLNNFDLNLPATADEEDEASAKWSPLPTSDHRTVQTGDAGKLNHQGGSFTNAVLRRISGKRTSSDNSNGMDDKLGWQLRAFDYPRKAGEELHHATEECKASLSSRSIHAIDSNASGEAPALAPVVTGCLPYYGDAILFNC